MVSLTAPADDEGLEFADFAVIDLVHVFVLMLIHSLGAASGAHFNPAVTIALMVRRKIEPGDAAFYIVLQLIEALLGALIAKILVDDFGAAVEYGSTTVSRPVPGRRGGQGHHRRVHRGLLPDVGDHGDGREPKLERGWAPFVIGCRSAWA